MGSKTGTRPRTFTHAAHALPGTSAGHRACFTPKRSLAANRNAPYQGDAFTSLCWQRSFEVGHAVVLLGVAGADDLDLVGRGAEIGQLGVGQLDFGGADVLIKPFGALGAGDRHNPGLLIEQPDQRELGGGGATSAPTRFRTSTRARFALSASPWNRGVRARMSVEANVVVVSMVPVRKPLPSGL